MLDGWLVHHMYILRNVFHSSYLLFFFIGLGSRQINDRDMDFRCGKTCLNCLTLIGLTKMTEIKTSKKTFDVMFCFFCFTDAGSGSGDEGKADQLKIFQF